MTNPVSVRVRLLGHDNVARAGNSYDATSASSTASAETAARRAAAKFFRCPEAKIHLDLKEAGDVVLKQPAIFSASKKEASDA